MSKQSFLIVTVFTALFVISQNASAKSWPSQGWFHINEGPDFCAINAEYSFDGRSDVKLSFFIEHGVDGAMLILSSRDWSVKDGLEYPGFTYELGKSTYSDPIDKAGEKIPMTHGMAADDNYNRFLALMPGSFVEDFANAGSLLVRNGDVIITNIRLDRSANAVKVLKECLAHVTASNLEQAKAKAVELKKEEQWNYIQKDPFASVTGKRPANLAPEPIGNMGNWATTNDYPSRALQQEREGTTTFRILVGTSGRPINCETIITSGHDDLDKAACVNAIRRARFVPGTDENGQPVEKSFDGSTRWQIPR